MDRYTTTGVNTIMAKRQLVINDVVYRFKVRKVVRVDGDKWRATLPDLRSVIARTRRKMRAKLLRVIANELDQ